MNEFRHKIDCLLAERSHLIRKLKEEKERLAVSQERIETAEAAQKIVQAVAESVQTKAHKQIAAVVSRCLESVFEDDAYEFKIQFERRRGRTEARLLLVRDGVELEPADAAGGGVVDVAAFALRLACLVLSRPVRRRLLVLDEPMKFLSKEYRPKVRELLEVLSKEMGIQIIMVTHDESLVTGKVVEL